MTKLSWTRGDIENLCGFKSGKFTNVNFIFTFILGLILCAVFYLALLPFRGHGIQLIEMFFHGGVENRSTIPYFTIFLTCWAMAMLAVKRLKLSLQRKALDMKIIPSDPNFVLTAVTANEVLANLYSQVDSPAHFILADRLERSLVNLRNLGSVSSVSECLKTSAENDDSLLSSSYTVLKGFIWAVPVLGFIGTVIGLSSAVGGFGSIVAKGAGVEELKASLGGVTGGLAVAFETTLIALVAALVVQLLLTFVLNREEMFLDECADYCHKNVLSRMRNALLTENRENS